MITKQTTVNTRDLIVKFTVYDDKDWIVSIDNNAEEFGTSSMPCNGNWNKGLANCINNLSEFITSNQLSNVLHSLKACKDIDNAFMDYLKENIDLCIGCPYTEECERITNPCWE